ncbi:DUF4173 domain-containing protein [Brevundimonas sp.]|jgi:hypothetical protein|uniref:DUF4173 domain-containing protein n=1 Tax=Brevundimonas sp. TaxID=1871086 RepID=UPI0037C03E6F
MLHTPILSRSSLWLKIALGCTLAVLADRLLFGHAPGSGLGLFALAAVLALVVTRKGLLRTPRGRAAVLAATALALILTDRPGFLAWLLFGLAVTVAALSMRIRANETAWAWAQRLALHGAFALFGPVVDLAKLGRLKRIRKNVSIQSLLLRLAMPIVGGAIFLWLFAMANPIIADLLDALALPALSGGTIARVAFGLVFLVGAMSLLRPRWRKPLLVLPTRKIGKPSPGLTTSIAWSLIVFNLVFALQNGLDIAFLWSGAPLPGDMSLADYAHRGAYPLIATALLAGLFVLVALQPGSDTARRPAVRGLVIVWIAQNMLLVASSLLRTADYIEAYALTRFRIAAVIWMVLVGVGLLLICWRMLRDKSAHWLIDANVAVTLSVLAVLSAFDLGAIAAGWNVRHAREAGGRGVQLDLGYLRGLGSPALVPLVELEQTNLPPMFADRVAAVRTELMAETQRRQGTSAWTWRDRRRLDRIEALTQGRPLATPRPGERTWDGHLRPHLPPVEPVTPAVVTTAPSTAPLTSRAGG